MTRLTQSLLCTALLLLCAAPPAPANIVHVLINQGIGAHAQYNAATGQWGDGFETYHLDVNSDGIDDLEFTNDATAIMGLYPSGWDNVVYGENGASPEASGGDRFATPLLIGDLVGPNLTFASIWHTATFFSNDAYHTTPDPYGNKAWTEPPDKYLGFQFNIAGQPHYGWVQVHESADASGLGFRDAAYETQPNTPIHAGEVPEPACTALAAGVTALLLNHRRRRHPIAQD